MSGVVIPAILIGLLLVAGLLFWVLRRRSPPTRPAPPVTVNTQAPRRRRNYYGVVFRPGSNACRFATALKDQRFLSEEAPRLPISGCDVDNCECLLIPTDDRRGKRDRRLKFSPLPDYEPDSSRSKAERGGDRRSDD